MRCLLLYTKMRTFLVVVADVFGHQTLQMPLVENNHMVEQVSSATTDETFGNPILPGTSEAGSLRRDVEVLDGLHDIIIELRTIIEDQVLWR